jgi:hypothetical protein
MRSERNSAESRLLLNETAGAIVNLVTDMKAQDGEILSLKALIEALSKEKEEARISHRSSIQPGPPMRGE